MISHGYKIKKSFSRKSFDFFSIIIISFLALVCLFPFVMIISASFSDEIRIVREGFSILPRGFSLDAYKLLLGNPSVIIKAFGVSIFVTVVGTVASLLITAMTAFALSRKDFKYRNFISFFFYFTTLFNGGLVATYIFVVSYLNLMNNYLALILPLLINVFHLLIMRTFIASIPESIVESAKIDGASEFRVFWQLILPLSLSGLATIGLFTALLYWNDWYSAMLYITTRSKWPLQYMLYDMLNQVTALSRLSTVSGISLQDMPSQTMRMAMAVVATGPVLLLYPFVQRYFVKGVTLGSVKG